MSMKNPPHLGNVVRVSCLESLVLNVTEGAKVLGVSHQALSNLVNCRARISTDMAVRLDKIFQLYVGDVDAAAGSQRCFSGISTGG